MRHNAEPAVHVYDLGGGSRAVVKLKSNIPLVTLSVAARGGAHNETAATAGLSGLLARTSLKGTRTRSAGAIAELAEGMGGTLAPSVSADVIDWEITVPARHFERALALVCDVALGAAFPAEEFEIERKLALADLQQSRDDMYRYPLRLCFEQAFRGHAYGTTIEDVERSVSAAQPGSLADWQHAQVRATPWAFVVGDVDPDVAARSIAELFPSGSSGDGVPTPAPATWAGASSAAEVRDKEQTALALAFPGPDRNHSDVYALQVLANAVGGLGGRFFEELRSRRSLAYTISVLPIMRWLGGTFVAYIATSPEKEAEARRRLLEQFARLTDRPLPESEVRRAQRYTIGTWQIRSQTNGSQLGDLMHAYLLGPGVSEITEFEKQVLAVTPEAILAAARTYFDPATAVEGIVRGKGRPNGR